MERLGRRSLLTDEARLRGEGGSAMRGHTRGRPGQAHRCLLRRFLPRRQVRQTSVM